MSRFKDLFSRKSDRVLNVYVTAGYPKIDSTLEIMEVLQHHGVDVIELGMPYSDPLADGPVIQDSSTVALNNGMTIEKLFKQLKGLRDKIHLPVVLMGYMNPVIQYGFERFCAEAEAVGIDGLILPDLPVLEYERCYGEILKKHNLDFIFLVTPETNEERVRKLDALSSGFLYAVSSSSTTGKEQDFSAVNSYLDKLRSYRLKNPVLVGFGIKDKFTFDAVQGHANGAIIGSAFIKALGQEGEPKAIASKFINSVLN